MTEKHLEAQAETEHAALLEADAQNRKPARTTQNNSRTSPSNHGGSAATGKTSDEQLQLKKRARRRLVGAIALALFAVIVLPMVMDQEPRPLTQDIQIHIPSQEQNSTSLIARISPNKATASPLPNDTTTETTLPPDSAEPPSEAKTESKPDPKVATNSPAPNAASTATPPTAAAPLTPPANKEVSKEIARDPIKDSPKTPKEPTKELAKEASKDPHKSAEIERASAILNDQAPQQQWIIQLGAYRDQGNINVLQAKLKELGYAAYTEKIDTPQGPRIRLRCGPFANREAAEKAQARLKKIGAGGPSGGVLSQK